MNSIKTGVVVVVLLGVLYGVYKVLNVPEPTLTKEEQESLRIAEEMTVDKGVETDPNSISFGAPPSLGDASSAHLTDASAAGQFSELPGDVPPLTEQPQATTELPQDDPSQQIHTNRHAMPDAVQTPLPDRTGGNFDAGTPVSPGDGSQVRNVAAAQVDNSFYVEQATKVAAPPAASDPVPQDMAGRVFERAMRTAEDLIAQGQYRDALAELTKFHEAPSLSEDEHQMLLNWLDPLAGKVIYSSEHLLGEPHVVRSGETIEDIAYEYDVPAQLLYNINRSKINNPRVLRPGTELKVVRGPFRAEVRLSTGKLTLFLGALYAGHFPITTGRDPAPQPGTYVVKQIVQGREYVGRDGQRIPVDSPENPYGGWWIDLGSEIAIHGSSSNGNADGRGCVSLSAVDIADLAEILSRESQVKIHN